ncbi:MAG: phosphotransferase [Proteobacteria bacterium]|nr:phosphotransferase [Pseudomonadota bacterium]
MTISIALPPADARKAAALMARALGDAFDAAGLRIESPIDGAVNRTWPVLHGGKKYALRLRREETHFRYEKGIAKTALVAAVHAAKLGGSPDAKAGEGLARATRGEIAPPFSPVLVHWSNGDELWPLPWELTAWCEGVTLARHADAGAIARAGEAIAAIHSVRFDGGYPDLLTLGSKPQSFAAWLEAGIARELARGRIPPALSRFVEKLAGHAARDVVWTLAHNDLHGLHLIDDAARATIWVIDWDNAAVAPPELDFVKLRYWTRVDAGSGKLTADPEIYGALRAAYAAAGGPVLDIAVSRACEALWLLRVFHFETDRANAGKPTPMLFPAAETYLAALNELARAA